jgi:hypothetical protein
MLGLSLAYLYHAAARDNDVALSAVAKAVPCGGFARFKSCPRHGKLRILLGIRHFNDVAAFFEKVFG